MQAVWIDNLDKSSRQILWTNELDIRPGMGSDEWGDSESDVRSAGAQIANPESKIENDPMDPMVR
jgi:hypothetical protein